MNSPITSRPCRTLCFMEGKLPVLLGKAEPLSGSGVDAGNPTAKLLFAPLARWGFWLARLGMRCHVGLCCRGDLCKSTPCFLHTGEKKSHLIVLL